MRPAIAAAVTCAPSPSVTANAIVAGFIFWPLTGARSAWACHCFGGGGGGAGLVSSAGGVSSGSWVTGGVGSGVGCGGFDLPPQADTNAIAMTNLLT